VEILQLNMFAALVEEGNLKRAAHRVLRSQPAVSMAIKRLEREVGSPLFRRQERGTYLLTPEGATLYCYALRLVRTHAEAISAMQRFHSNTKTMQEPKSGPELAKGAR
jgi:DNA-binding transcriptional LysR family regulator